jgi:hypothetical protein
MQCFECHTNLDVVTARFCAACGSELCVEVQSSGTQVSVSGDGAINTDTMAWYEEIEGRLAGSMSAPMRWAAMPDGGFMIACRGLDKQFGVFVLEGITEEQHGIPKLFQKTSPNRQLNLGPELLDVRLRHRGCFSLGYDQARYHKLDNSGWSEVVDFTDLIDQERVIASASGPNGFLFLATIKASGSGGPRDKNPTRLRLWREHRHLQFEVIGDIDVANPAAGSVSLLASGKNGAVDVLTLVSQNAIVSMSVEGVPKGQYFLADGIFQKPSFGQLERFQFGHDATLIVLSIDRNGENLICAFHADAPQQAIVQEAPKWWHEKMVAISRHGGLVVRTQNDVCFVELRDGKISKTSPQVAPANVSSLIAHELNAGTAIIAAGSDGLHLEFWPRAGVPIQKMRLKMITNQGVNSPNPGVVPIVTKLQDGAGRRWLNYVSTQPSGVGWRAERIKLEVSL